VARELLECSADRELVGGSEDRELAGGSVHCVALDRNVTVGVFSSRGPTVDLLGEDRRKLVFLSSFGVHVMKRLAALELTGLISWKAFELPLFGGNIFL
jgi:hypothetical protein